MLVSIFLCDSMCLDYLIDMYAIVAWELDDAKDKANVTISHLPMFVLTTLRISRAHESVSFLVPIYQSMYIHGNMNLHLNAHEYRMTMNMTSHWRHRLIYASIWHPQHL